jgi:hypothetical protein
MNFKTFECSVDMTSAKCCFSFSTPIIVYFDEFPEQRPEKSADIKTLFTSNYGGILRSAQFSPSGISQTMHQVMCRGLP